MNVFRRYACVGVTLGPFSVTHRLDWVVRNPLFFKGSYRRFSVQPVRQQNANHIRSGIQQSFSIVNAFAAKISRDLADPFLVQVGYRGDATLR